MMIRTIDADIAITRDGVIRKGAAMHGDAEITTWRWDEVRRITVVDGGRATDRTMTAGLGVLGLLFRPKRVHVVMSPVVGDDVVWQTRRPVHEVRSEARRLLDDVPAAAGKIVVD
jgi:predicted phosphoribosyltransferase